MSKQDESAGSRYFVRYADEDTWTELGLREYVTIERKAGFNPPGNNGRPAGPLVVACASFSTTSEGGLYGSNARGGVEGMRWQPGQPLPSPIATG